MIRASIRNMQPQTKIRRKTTRLKDGWFLGIDLGTGSCKCVVVDEQAKIMGFGAGDYAKHSAQQKWNEQDPASLLSGMIQAAHAAVEQAGTRASACQGISIGGAMHSLIALDHAGQPVTGVITWADGRGASYAQSVRQSPIAAELYQQTGCPPHGMYPLYKLLWLRQERPDLFAQSTRFVTAKEFIFQKLTGQWVVDYSIASGSGLLNLHSLRWNPNSLDIAGIQEEALSSPMSPIAVFPLKNSVLAEAIGISPQTPVVIGSSDAANSNIGAGAMHPWQATAMIGTSGAFRIIAPQPFLDEKARLWCYGIDETHWLVGGAINNGGIALAWLKDAINQTISQPNQAELTFQSLVELAGQVGAGSEGLICLPFFAGERSPNWNLNARAAFFGMTLQHDARHLARAAMEGVAYRLRSLNEILTGLVGDIREIRASGGFTHSNLWPQIIASTFNRDLMVPAWGETSSLGAALWAMRGVGALTSLEEAEKLIPIGSRYAPLPHDAAIYDQLFHLYLDLYPTLEKAFDRVAEIQREIGSTAVS
jgi:gluconokinase